MALPLSVSRPARPAMTSDQLWSARVSLWSARNLILDGEVSWPARRRAASEPQSFQLSPTHFCSATPSPPRASRRVHGACGGSQSAARRRSGRLLRRAGPLGLRQQLGRLSTLYEQAFTLGALILSPRPFGAIGLDRSGEEVRLSFREPRPPPVGELAVEFKVYAGRVVARLPVCRGRFPTGLPSRLTIAAFGVRRRAGRRDAVLRSRPGHWRSSAGSAATGWRAARGRSRPCPRRGSAAATVPPATACRAKSRVASSNSASRPPGAWRRRPRRPDEPDEKRLPPALLLRREALEHLLGRLRQGALDPADRAVGTHEVGPRPLASDQVRHSAICSSASSPGSSPTSLITASARSSRSRSSMPASSRGSIIAACRPSRDMRRSR